MLRVVVKPIIINLGLQDKFKSMSKPKLITILDSSGKNYIRDYSKNNASSSTSRNNLYGNDYSECINNDNIRNIKSNFSDNIHNKSTKNIKQIRQSKNLNYENHINDSVSETKIIEFNKDYYDCSFVRIKKENRK